MKVIDVVHVQRALDEGDMNKALQLIGLGLDTARDISIASIVTGEVDNDSNS